MAKATLYHNPRCTKSCQTLELLRERRVDFDVIEYLETLPDRDTILALVRGLGGNARSLVRTTDAAFAQAGLELSPEPTATEVADLLVANPRVMQRPIFEMDGRVAIGRPPERVLEILDQ